MLKNELVLKPKHHFSIIEMGEGVILTFYKLTKFVILVRKNEKESDPSF